MDENDTRFKFLFNYFRIEIDSLKARIEKQDEEIVALKNQVGPKAGLPIWGAIGAVVAGCAAASLLVKLF